VHEELAAAGRKVTSRAGGAQHKGYFIRKHSTRDNVNKKPGKDEWRRRDAGKAQKAKRE
jgi:molybdopterin-guanine dinucleotide biosynthesis protein